MSAIERPPAPVLPLYEPARIPAGAPSKVDPPAGTDLITVNFGPNHPSTHGVLRLIVTLDGEVVVGLDADIGYVHTGFEKNFEQKTYWKGIPYSPRMDYVAFFANELAYVGAVERLIEIDVPPRAQWIRMLFAELNRIHSHLIYLGTSAVEMGALSVFFYCLRERDSVLDLFEMATGVRMHDRYPQFGGVAEDLPKGFYAECRRFCAEMPKRIDEYLDLLAGNPVWKSRYQGIGTIDAETAVAMGLSGPNLRASGVAYDLRRLEPYLAYDQVQFDVITREKGDAYDRFMCRTLEMYESVKIVEQCLDSMPPGPVMSDDRKFVLPPRHELHTSMESLIHHFKLVTEGFRVPRGPGLPPCRVAARGVRLLPGVRRRHEAVAGALPRAELREPPGDGDDVGQPLRRRHDRGRRLPRRRHGRGRQVSDPAAEQTMAGARETRPQMPAPAHDAAPEKPLRERILDVMALYPEPRSAIIPALRLAQEEYGWLSTEALEAVADATGFTPALAKSVASFYDMFRLTQAGVHEICVCTNVSCALVGAGETLRELERQLGIHAGQTTPDGTVTLRTVECYGGCGWGPVVSVDERYHEPCGPEQVAGILAELRGEPA